MRLKGILKDKITNDKFMYIFPNKENFSLYRLKMYVAKIGLDIGR